MHIRREFTGQNINRIDKIQLRDTFIRDKYYRDGMNTSENTFTRKENNRQYREISKDQKY